MEQAAGLFSPTQSYLQIYKMQTLRWVISLQNISGKSTYEILWGTGNWLYTTYKNQRQQDTDPLQTIPNNTSEGPNKSPTWKGLGPEMNSSHTQIV